MTDTYMTLEDVGKRLQLSIHTVRNHYKSGLLPATKLGRRVRVTQEQFDDYVRRLEAVGRVTPGPGRFVMLPTTGPDPEREAAAVVEAIRAAIRAGDLDHEIAEACDRLRGRSREK